MKKRIKEKVTKRVNKARMLAITKPLFDIYPCSKFRLQDGYYAYMFDKNSVCYFVLKAYPNIQFGIWLSKCNTYTLFAEHVAFIDKFKPSAVEYVFNDIPDLISFLNGWDYDTDVATRYNFDIKDEAKIVAEAKYFDEHQGFFESEYNEAMSDGLKLMQILKSDPAVDAVYYMRDKRCFRNIFDIFIIEHLTDEEYDKYRTICTKSNNFLVDRLPNKSLIKKLVLVQ